MEMVRSKSRLIDAVWQARDVGVDQLNFWGEILNRCVGDRDALGFEDRIIDVAFADLLEDPLRVVQGIYERFSLDLGEDTIARMRRFLDDNRRHSHGVHKYTLEQFGLDGTMIVERFGDYIERFIRH